jgi:hypothetical protein
VQGAGLAECRGVLALGEGSAGRCDVVAHRAVDAEQLGPVSEGLFIWIFGIGGLIALTVWITAKSN